MREHRHGAEFSTDRGYHDAQPDHVDRCGLDIRGVDAARHRARRADRGRSHRRRPDPAWRRRTARLPVVADRLCAFAGLRSAAKARECRRQGGLAPKVDGGAAYFHVEGCVMILGLSISAFTIVHVLISLVGIVAGVIVAFGMVRGKRLPGWTALALVALILTSVTGFFFSNTTFTPAQAVGIVSLVALAIAVAALYVFHVAGVWRWIYAVTAMAAIYLDV